MPTDKKSEWYTLTIRYPGSDGTEVYPATVLRIKGDAVAYWREELTRIGDVFTIEKES